jgi:hypothetical protein
MPLRTRSLLMDNTIGKIYTNVGATSEVNSSKLIAGTSLKSYVLSSKTATRVANNLSGTGFPFTSTGLIQKLTLSVSNAPVGASIIVALKKGTDYANSTTSATANIASGVRTGNSSISLSVSAGEFIFFDVTQVGSTSSGQKLSIRLDYFLG